MNEFVIRLRSVSEVEEFVALATACKFRVNVSDGQHVVNGSSFMQMFCLILSSPLTVTTECDGDAFEGLKDSARRFLVQ